MMSNKQSAHVAVEKLRMISDDRGTVFEPLFAEELVRQKNAHLVISKPGVVRGNHFHLKGTEIIAVLGPALVKYRIANNIEDVHIPDCEVYRFISPPGVAHAIQHSGDRDGVLVAFNTEPHDPDQPDTRADRLI
jgi:dTDP-4-dehydrorhamnose 3,5-epimerase-like enzyme